MNTTQTNELNLKTEAGRASLYKSVKAFFKSAKPVTCAQIAAELGMSTAQIRNVLLRLLDEQVITATGNTRARTYARA